MGLTAAGSISYNSSYIDAISFHVYPSAGVGGITIEEADLSNVFTEPLRSIDNMKIVPEQGGTGEFLVFQNDTYFEGWITEFGLTDASVVGLFGTWAQGLYQALMALRFLEEDHITHIGAQTLLGNSELDQPSFAIFNNEGIDGEGGHAFEFSGIGNAMLPLCQAFRFSTTATKIDFDINDSDPSYFLDSENKYPILYGWYLSGSTSDQAIILNLSGNSQTIKTIGLFPDGGAIEQYYGWDFILSENDALASVIGDYDENGSLGVKIDKSILNDPGDGPYPIGQNTLVLPPYSITRIHYDKETLIVYSSAQGENICAGQQVTISAYAPNATSLLFTGAGGLNTILPGSRGAITIYPLTGPYTVMVTASNFATSQIVINVNAGPSITVSPSSASLCPGVGSVKLTASAGATSYNWSPSTGLFDDEALQNPTESGITDLNGNTVYAAPQTSQTYYMNPLQN